METIGTKFINWNRMDNLWNIDKMLAVLNAVKKYADKNEYENVRVREVEAEYDSPQDRINIDIEFCRKGTNWSISQHLIMINGELLDDKEFHKRKEAERAGLQIYNGQDILISYNGKKLLIAEGTGDNLTSEDEADGYVDYFNLEVYDIDDNSEYPDTIGGGFMMRQQLIADELYGKTVDEVIKEVFQENGPEDDFELYSTSLPEYKILAV